MVFVDSTASAGKDNSGSIEGNYDGWLVVWEQYLKDRSMKQETIRNRLAQLDILSPQIARRVRVSLSASKASSIRTLLALPGVSKRQRRSEACS